MDPYKILGVNKGATKEEVERAYRKKAAKHHPDKGGETWAFQQVQDAYKQIESLHCHLHELEAMMRK